MEKYDKEWHWINPVFIRHHVIIIIVTPINTLIESNHFLMHYSSSRERDIHSNNPRPCTSYRQVSSISTSPRYTL